MNRLFFVPRKETLQKIVSPFLVEEPQNEKKNKKKKNKKDKRTWIEYMQQAGAQKVRENFLFPSFSQCLVNLIFFTDLLYCCSNGRPGKRSGNQGQNFPRKTLCTVFYRNESRGLAGQQKICEGQT